MVKIARTEDFTRWLDRLPDRRAKMRIELRLSRASAGHLGGIRSVGGGVSEMRIDYGPGYRLYFARSSDTLVVLLCGGDKSTQARDIVRAKRIAASVEQ